MWCITLRSYEFGAMVIDWGDICAWDSLGGGLHVVFVPGQQVKGETQWESNLRCLHHLLYNWVCSLMMVAG